MRCVFVGTVGDGGKDMDGEAEAERAGETRVSSSSIFWIKEFMDSPRED